jgi:hypothetical protein
VLPRPLPIPRFITFRVRSTLMYSHFGNASNQSRFRDRHVGGDIVECPNRIRSLLRQNRDVIERASPLAIVLMNLQPSSCVLGGRQPPNGSHDKSVRLRGMSQTRHQCQE